ncbi:hypothetical protein XENORESO_001636 [Xenotaenia resolanae]|uniref:Uncharacterized protein n=1 Tax=Xenotaenia resolanae TaxID=208358 RepID=A0ABV0W0E9_9TELE
MPMMSKCKLLYSLEPPEDADCRFNCHKRCEPSVPRDCPGERRAVNGGDLLAAAPSFPQDPEDAESELASTTLDTSEDEMSSDGDTLPEMFEVEQPMRLESVTRAMLSFCPDDVRHLNLM